MRDIHRRSSHPCALAAFLLFLAGACGNGGDGSGGGGQGGQIPEPNLCEKAHDKILARYETCGIETGSGGGGGSGGSGGGGAPACSEEDGAYFTCVASCTDEASCSTLEGYNMDGILVYTDCIGGCNGQTGGGGTGGGSGGTGGSGTGGSGTGGSGTGGSGTGGAAPCSTCGQYITVGEGNGPLCEGDSTTLYNTFADCVCFGPCMALCSDNICDAAAATDPCMACLQDNQQGCGDDLDACINDG